MPKAKSTTARDSVEHNSKLFRDLLLGFVKIHVLHHASLDAVYGVGIAAELETHGYKLSPGTLYPLLHNLEAADLLVREDWIVDGKRRKYYRITPLGQLALDEARGKLVELVDEVVSPKSKTKTGSKAVAGRKRNS